MGWHRNHAISHSPNQFFFEDTFVSHPGGPNEQFGTHEKLSWGVQGNLIWMPGYTVGDEFHYVLECCFFDFDRKIFLPHIKRKPVNCFTYANIFNDTNFRRLRRLCNFLKIVIDTFRSRPR